MLSAQDQLFAVRVSEDNPTAVTRTAQRGIATFKNRIAELADAYMACAAGDISLRAIASDFNRFAHGNGKPGPNSPVVGIYGDQLRFDVKRHGPNLVGIVATFDIACGDDAMLLIYRRDSDGWSPALRWQSGDYDTVGGGLWSFDYAVSPPDAAGRWFVAEKSVAPWCSSTWSEIRYAVLRPGATASTPKILGKSADSIWWGSEDFGTIAVTKDSADFRFHAESIDDGIHNRLWIRRFHVVGDTVERVQPVAVSPRDFVDEWIVSPWAQAKAWSLPEHMTVLHAAHEIAVGERKDEGFEFASAQKCADAPDHYQITLTPMDESRPSYFQVRGKTEFTMLSVDRAPAKACAGKNILDTMAAK